jgi:predicted flap endonuclease-1-like 5' DNA nuclease
VVAAAAFSLAVLFGMDRWNTDSLRPQLEGLWVASPSAKQSLASTPYRDIFVLAGAEAEDVAEATAGDVSSVGDWVTAAQLSTLRGIGTKNAELMWEIGINSLEELAAADPHWLGEEMRARATRPRTATAPKVRVWVQAARRVTRSSSSLAEQ